MKSTQTFSILIWANKKKASSEGMPLFARITVNGKRAEISLKKKVFPDKWDPKGGFAKGNGEESKMINNYISQVKSELFRKYSQMLIFQENITAESLKLKYTGEKEEKRTILQVFDYHNSQMSKIVGIDVVRATHIKFITIRNKLSKFIKLQYKKSDYILEDLNHQFVSNFEYYLKTEERIQHNTTMKYIQNLKKIIHLAIRNQWLTKDPFIDFHSSFHKVNRDVLMAEEVDKIADKHYKISRLQLVADLFVFSCYTGLAYIDVMKLTDQNLSIGIDKELWLFTERKKTGEKVKVPLLPQAIAILNKYKNNPSCLNTNTLFPRISNQRLNSYLKEIADICGITKNLTFHLARHTFATTITLANGVPIETVSKLLGHSSIKTTQIYAKVIEKKVSEDMHNLKSRLTKKSSPRSIRKN